MTYFTRTNQAGHKCSSCGEYFRTGSQLRMHYGNKHNEKNQQRKFPKGE